MRNQKRVFGLVFGWMLACLPLHAQQCGWDFWNVFVLGWSEAAGWKERPDMALMEVRFGDTVLVENQLEIRTGKEWLRSKQEKNPLRNLEFLRYPYLWHVFFPSRPEPSMYLFRVRGNRLGKGQSTVYYPLYSGEACHVCSFLRSQKVEEMEVRPFRAIAVDVPRVPDLGKLSSPQRPPVWIEPVYRRVSEKGKLPVLCELVAVRSRREGFVLQEFLFEGNPKLDTRSDPALQQGYFSPDHNRPEKDFSVLRRRQTNAQTHQMEAVRDFYFFVHQTQTYVKDDVLSAAENVWYQPVEDLFYRKELRREGDRLWKYRRGVDRNWVFVSGEKPEAEVPAAPPPKTPRLCWIQKSESPNGYLPVVRVDSQLTVRDTFYLWNLVDKPLPLKEVLSDHPNCFRVPANSMPGAWTPVYYEETLPAIEPDFTWNTRSLRIESKGCSTQFLELRFLQAGKKVEEIKTGDTYTWQGPVLPDSTREILFGSRFRYPIRKGFVHLRNSEPLKRWDQHLQTEEPPGFLYKSRFLTLICDSLPVWKKQQLQFFEWDGKVWKPAFAGFSEGEPGVHLGPNVDSIRICFGKEEARFSVDAAQKMAESKMYLPPLLNPGEPYLLLNGLREPFLWLEDEWAVWVKGSVQHMPDDKRPNHPPQKADPTMEAVRLRYTQKYPEIRVSVNNWSGVLSFDLRNLSEKNQQRVFQDWEGDADLLVVCPKTMGRRIPVFSGHCLFKVSNPQVGLQLRKEAELFGFQFSGLEMDGTVRMQWVKAKRLDYDFFNTYHHLLKIKGVVSGILDGFRSPAVELTE